MFTLNSKGCNLVASLIFTPASVKEIQQVERHKVVKLNQSRVWGGLFICICESRIYIYSCVYIYILVYIYIYTHIYTHTHNFNL